MSDWVALAIPAVAAGLFGSAHCLGMCGGLSGLFAMHTGARSTASQPLLAVTYNLGRIASYATLGALSAYAGQGLTDVLPGLAVPIRLAAGLVIVLMGIQIAFGWQLLGPVEKVGSYLWRLVSPLTKHVLPVTSAPKALALGLLWGLLPCGLVFSMLLVAMAGSDPLHGAIVMVAFGIGTMPSMLLTGLGAASLNRLLSNKRRALVAGLLLVAIGVATMAMPAIKILGPGNGGHAHHEHMAAGVSYETFPRNPAIVAPS